MEWYKVFDSEKQAKDRFPLLSVFKIKAGGKEICMAHTPAGFMAVENTCPHQGFPLSEGKCNFKGEIVCPLHAYRFDMDSGEEMSGNPCRSAKTFAIKVDETGLYVGA